MPITECTIKYLKSGGKVSPRVFEIIFGIVLADEGAVSSY